MSTSTLPVTSRRIHILGIGIGIGIGLEAHEIVSSIATYGYESFAINLDKRSNELACSLMLIYVMMRSCLY